MPIKEAQKTHTQHAVPQNIMDVEYKLIGDLTMRQFVYLLIFGVLAYVVSITLTGVFKWPLIIFFILLGLALAFYTIQERGMDEWVVNFVKAMYSPTQRIWKRELVLPTAFTYQNLAVVRQEMITLAPTSSRRKLEEYLELQGQRREEDPLDIPEKEYLVKVRDAFGSTDTAGSSTSTLLSPEPQPEFETAQQQQYKPFQPPIEVESTQTLQQVSNEEQALPDDSITEPQIEEQVASINSQKEAVEEPSNLSSGESQIVQPVSSPVREERPKVSMQPLRRTFPQTTFVASPITPDRHVGRRFTSMLPSEGMLVLPIRGETVLQTSEEMGIEKDIMDRTEQLRKLLDQIKGDDQFKGILTGGVDIPQEALSEQKIFEAQDVVAKVKEENDKLAEEIQRLKAEAQSSQETVAQKQHKESLIKKLEEEKNQANTDYADLQKQVLELQKRLKEKEEAASRGQGPQNVDVTYAKMQPITNEPNIVSGVLKDSGGEPVVGSVLLIKNHKGEAVRAVKTNTIGQFAISTPLTNGMYTIENGTETPGLTFDIITVEVKGEIIPPIEISGRPV